MKQDRIDVHVEELVVASQFGDGDVLAEAFREELSRLLAEEDLSFREQSEERQNGKSMEIRFANSPEATGRRVARALFGELSR